MYRSVHQLTTWVALRGLGGACLATAQSDSLDYRIDLDSVTVQPASAKRSARSPVLGAGAADFSEAAAFTPGLTLRNAGPAGVSSYAYRGVSGARIDERWEGIRVNDPQLGVNDLSERNGFLTPRIRAHSAAGGPTAYAISAAQDTSRAATAQLRLAQGRGYQLGLGYGGARLLARSDQFDFPHTSPSGSVRPQARLRQLGGAYTLDRGPWASRTLFVHSDRNLPVSAFESLAGSELGTTQLRQLVSFRKNNWSISAAYPENRLRYKGVARQLASRGKTQQAVVGGDYGFNGGWSLHSDSRRIWATNTNYSDKIIQDRTETSVRYRRTLGKQPLRAEAGVLGATRFGVQPFGALAVERAVADQRLTLKALLRRTARLPNLDDACWSDGGDAALAIERGWHGELGAGASLAAWRVEATGFASRYGDYIVWLPGNPFWRPTSVPNVTVLGGTVGLANDTGLRELRVRSRIDLTYTDASFRSRIDRSYTGRLPFRPQLSGREI